MKHLLVLSIGLVVAAGPACGSSGSGSKDAAGGDSAGTGGAGSSSGGSTSESTSPTNGGSSVSTSGEAHSGGTAGATTTADSPYAGKLAINELVPSNKSGAMDESGAYPDWVELYNASAEDIALSGFFLSDSPDEPTKAALASGLTIKAGGVLQLWADGDTEQGNQHLPFKLSAAGESILLFDAEQKLIDAVEFGSAAADASYSRLPDGTGAFAWCTKGTPNKPNGAACPE